MTPLEVYFEEVYFEEVGFEEVGFEEVRFLLHSRIEKIGRDQHSTLSSPSSPSSVPRNVRGSCAIVRRNVRVLYAIEGTLLDIPRRFPRRHEIRGGLS